jgi:hypothetical protein
MVKERGGRRWVQKEASEQRPGRWLIARWEWEWQYLKAIVEVNAVSKVHELNKAKARKGSLVL